MATVDRFLGRWELVPDQSEYDLGSPPASGMYEIIREGDKLTFKMEWMDAEGIEQKMAYSEICDGKFHAYPNTEIADEICLSLKSDHLLESLAKKNGKIVLSAKRELLTDFDLKVTMSGPLPNGDVYNNVALYRKR